MREIKFRAYDKVNNIMMYNAQMMHDYSYYDKYMISEYIYNGSILSRGSFYSMILDKNIILMPYTGLKDKNKKEIYEGDILNIFEVSENDTKEYISVVKFIESGFLVTEPNECQVPLAAFHNLDKTYPLFEIEVIGNIYENPELLEEVK